MNREYFQQFLLRNGLINSVSMTDIEAEEFCSGFLMKCIQELIVVGMQCPDDHIQDYMLRYWIFSPEESKALNLPFCGVRLHRILREDYDRHPHNHPWKFRSFILTGGYSESLLSENGSLVVNDVRPGRSYARGRESYHRITQIYTDEPLWTLCVFSEMKNNGWGFMTENGHVDSHSYLEY